MMKKIVKQFLKLAIVVVALRLAVFETLRPIMRVSHFNISKYNPVEITQLGGCSGDD